MRRFTWQLDGEACLPIEAHGVLEAILDEELLIVLGPLGSDDGRLFANGMPELFGDVRSEGGEEDEERLEYLARSGLQTCSSLIQIMKAATEVLKENCSTSCVTLRISLCKLLSSSLVAGVSVTRRPSAE